MRYLDSREQKSPQFLIDEFPELVECKHLEGKTGCSIIKKECPFTGLWAKGTCVCKKYEPKGLKQLPSGDYLSAEKVPNNLVPAPFYEEWQRENNIPTDHLEGNLVEYKRHKDYRKGSEQLQRLQDELYRMRCWQAKNPHVEIHCYWQVESWRYGTAPFEEELKLFINKCSAYHVWPHWGFSDAQFVVFLKKLDQPKSYQRDVVYMKKSHEEPTLEARRFRQIGGVSSEMAEELASTRYLNSGNMIFNSTIYSKARKAIRDVVGYKKDGSPKRLSYKIEFALENGREPTKQELDDKIAWRNLEEGK